MKKILLFLIRIYQISLSSAVHSLCHSSCAFYPSCSEYSFKAIKKYGAFKGSAFALKRIFRCYPFRKPTYNPLT